MYYHNIIITCLCGSQSALSSFSLIILSPVILYILTLYAILFPRVGFLVKFLRLDLVLAFMIRIRNLGVHVQRGSALSETVSSHTSK